mmetsp:Transcript_4865/g.5270  ORF Transcript_4865/g.5270 Transcript_4865/m.5270 type:complete len:392 (-) Transcript_4865:49-1224(-)
MNASKEWIESRVGSQQSNEHYEKLYQHYSSKLWHQLTVYVEGLLSQENALSNEQLLELHNCFLKEFAGRLNPRAYARIAVRVCAFIEPAKRPEFLEEAGSISSVQREPYADALISAAKASSLVTGSTAPTKEDKAQAKTHIANAEKTIEFASADAIVDTFTTAAIYKAQAELSKVSGDPVGFFKNGLSYLAYTPLETLRTNDRLNWAANLGIAALIGKEIYNFGELTTHPILKSLEGTGHQWLATMLKIFNEGDIVQYKKFLNEYAGQLKEQLDLVNNQATLEAKIAVLSLIQLVFSKPSDDRTITFDTIAKHTQLPVDHVERLVMKAQSLKLIRGTIDQVKQRVIVTWVQPRVLELSQVVAMTERLGEWCNGVKEALNLFQAHDTTVATV